jgi:hypothetical protein
MPCDHSGETGNLEEYKDVFRYKTIGNWSLPGSLFCFKVILLNVH